MAKKNITLKIDEAILKAAKHSAVAADQSLSEWAAELIAKAIMDQGMLKKARAQALKILDNPLHLGGQTFRREQLHER